MRVESLELRGNGKSLPLWGRWRRRTDSAPDEVFIIFSIVIPLFKVDDVVLAREAPLQGARSTWKTVQWTVFSKSGPIGPGMPVAERRLRGHSQPAFHS